MYDLSPEENEPKSAAEEEWVLPWNARRKRKGRRLFTEDIKCIQCGYNLRGLSQDHRCPECGFLAVLSAGEDLLHYASIPWLRSMRLGLALLILGTVISACSTALILIPFLSWMSWSAWVALYVVGIAMDCMGVILCTRPEPKDALGDKHRILRSGLRVLVVLRLFVIIFVARQATAAVPGADWVIMLSGYGMWLLTIHGLLYYFQDYADRLAHIDLAIDTHRVVIGLAFCLGLVLLGLLLSLPFVGTSQARPPLCMMVFASTGVVFFTPVCYFMLFRYYTAFKWCIHEAKRTFPEAID